jgi:hypothetical protein
MSQLSKPDIWTSEARSTDISLAVADFRNGQSAGLTVHRPLPVFPISGPFRGPLARLKPANIGHMHCTKLASSLDHLVGAGQ